MNIYVIYRFSDYENVKRHMDNVRNEVHNITFFHFKPNVKNHFWHLRAIKKIKESNMVIFFDSFQNEPAKKVKHIKWELKVAEHFKKRIVVFKDNVENISAYSSNIYKNDYSDDFPNRFRYKTISTDKIVSFLYNEANWNVEKNLIKLLTREGATLSDENKQLLLEQYKIMIDTSEKLMDRRQATGNLYTTVCSALLAFVGTTVSEGISMLSSIAFFTVGVISVILSLNWKSSLRAYELNNGGKFEVINYIERNLPAEMFECEYRYNTLNGIKSYSSRERRLPIVYLIFGGVLAVIGAVMFFYCIKK